jgi:hypothetical protein
MHDLTSSTKPHIINKVKLSDPSHDYYQGEKTHIISKVQQDLAAPVPGNPGASRPNVQELKYIHHPSVEELNYVPIGIKNMDRKAYVLSIGGLHAIQYLCNLVAKSIRRAQN